MFICSICSEINNDADLKTKAAKKRQIDSIKDFMPEVLAERIEKLFGRLCGRRGQVKRVGGRYPNHYKRLKYLAEGSAIASGVELERAMCCYSAQLQRDLDGKDAGQAEVLAIGDATADRDRLCRRRR